MKVHNTITESILDALDQDLTPWHHPLDPLEGVEALWEGKTNRPTLHKNVLSPQREEP